MSILISHQYIIELIGILLLNGIDLPFDGQTALFLKKFDERAETDDECKLLITFPTIEYFIQR